jgi:hypothetical protein
MNIFTRTELAELRRAIGSDPGVLARSPDVIDRLLCQAEYGLDCAQLLEEAVHYPAEPYGEAEVLVARLTDGWNEIWNRHHYRAGEAVSPLPPSPAR